MRAVVISGGTITDYDYIRKQIDNSDIIICADSGYNHAVKMGICVNAVVGDFDSLGDPPSGVAAFRYPARKDLTDTEIAIAHARGMGIKDFLLLAATGNRQDHTLANILMLRECMERGENAVIMDEHNKIMVTDSNISLHEPPGSIVSLIPLTDCFGVTTTNLEYPLCGAGLRVGRGLGVSNIVIGDYAHISLQNGVLLVIVAKD